MWRQMRVTDISDRSFNEDSIMHPALLVFLVALVNQVITWVGKDFLQSVVSTRVWRALKG